MLLLIMSGTFCFFSWVTFHSPQAPSLFISDNGKYRATTKKLCTIKTSHTFKDCSVWIGNVYTCCLSDQKGLTLFISDRFAHIIILHKTKNKNPDEKNILNSKFKLRYTNIMSVYLKNFWNDLSTAEYEHGNLPSDCTHAQYTSQSKSTWQLGIPRWTWPSIIVLNYKNTDFKQLQTNFQHKHTTVGFTKCKGSEAPSHSHHCVMFCWLLIINTF